MRLYLVRHGESFANKEGIFQGQGDSGLTELGYMQARKVAKRLKDEDFDLIYSSDLRRARETAEEIAKFHSGKITFDERLRERSMGIWEGLLNSDVDFNSLEGDVFEKKPPDGESRGEHSMRLREFVDLKEKEFKGKKILIVSHGGTVRLVIKNLLNVDFSDALLLKIPNSSLSVIDFSKGEPDLVVMGCVRHLED